MRTEMRQLAFEAFGVQVVVSTNSPRVFDALESLLPAGWRPSPATQAARHFTVTVGHDGLYQFRDDDAPVPSDAVITANAEEEMMLGVIDCQLRRYVAENAPDDVFVHAGVVAHRERAIVIPGASMSGKTTMVAELVRAGATYYSDEYAVLDADGLVHPYAKRLSIRDEDFIPTDHPVAAFGGTAGEEPLPVGLVAVTSYQPGAGWEPRRLSPGAGVLALLANALPAQERPAQCLEAITRALEGAVVLEGERGEAAAIAEQLLESVPV